MPCPATRPPKGSFPRPPARGLPPRRASARQPDHAAGQPADGQSTAAHRHCSSRSGSLHRSSVKATRPRPQGNVKPCPSRRRDRHPVLLGLAPSAFLRGIKSRRQVPLFVCAAEIVPTRFKDYSPASWLRSSLSLSGLISLGFSKKYSVGYEAQAVRSAVKRKKLSSCWMSSKMAAMDNSFPSVWQRIEAHQDKPFLMPSGREFHYQIASEETLRVSCHREPIDRATIEEALQSMPCESFQKLPKHLKPRNVLWTLLSDTRIYERTKFTAYQSKKYPS